MKRTLLKQDVPLMSCARLDALLCILRKHYREARQHNFEPDHAADYALYRYKRTTEDDIFLQTVAGDGRRRVNGMCRTRA